jgi:hypothetical protein
MINPGVEVGLPPEDMTTKHLSGHEQNIHQGQNDLTVTLILQGQNDLAVTLIHQGQNDLAVTLIHQGHNDLKETTVTGYKDFSLHLATIVEHTYSSKIITSQNDFCSKSSGSSSIPIIYHCHYCTHPIQQLISLLSSHLMAKYSSNVAPAK